MRRSVPLLVPLALALGLAGCSSSPADSTGGSDAAGSGPLVVAANFYPVEWLVSEIGGEQVDVVGLTPPGTEPHDLILDPKTRAALAEASVVFYLGSDFQPDVERAVQEDGADQTSVDLLTAPGVTLLDAPPDLGKESLSGGKDPHVWLDPQEMAAMADEVARVLAEARPEDADEFLARGEALRASLAALDTELAAALTGCRTTTVVTSHAAFQYLADRYGLQQIAVRGVSPDDEPDAATLAEIADKARAAGVSTVFFEETLPSDLSQVVADEIGARIDLLSALEFDPEVTQGPGLDYLTVMSDNGRRLAQGLECG